MRINFTLFRTALIFYSILCFAQSAIAASSVSDLCLRVTDDSGKAQFVKPVKDGDVFAIRFIHSVALSPVTDFYMVKDGKIVLDKTIYQDFGAGLPHDVEGEQKMKVEDGEIILEGFNRELPEFYVRVGRIARHALLFPGSDGAADTQEEYPLANFAKPGAALHFSLSSDCRK